MQARHEIARVSDTPSLLFLVYRDGSVVVRPNLALDVPFWAVDYLEVEGGAAGRATLKNVEDLEAGVTFSGLDLSAPVQFRVRGVVHGMPDGPWGRSMEPKRHMVR